MIDFKTKVKIKAVKTKLFFYKLFTTPSLFLTEGTSSIYLKKLNLSKITVGRLGTDILLNSEAVSKKHAIIKKEGVNYYLQDLYSTNGTFLNGEKLIPEMKYILLDEDLILFGDVEIRFERKF